MYLLISGETAYMRLNSGASPSSLYYPDTPPHSRKKVGTGVKSFPLLSTCGPKLERGKKKRRKKKQEEEGSGAKLTNNTMKSTSETSRVRAIPVSSSTILLL